jgi:transaldolase
MQMKPTQQLLNLGQSNISRDLLTSGTFARYIEGLSFTGLTSNPTIFDHAIKNSMAYDSAIPEKLDRVESIESLFFELALEHVRAAADLFRPAADHYPESVNIFDGQVRGIGVR